VLTGVFLKTWPVGLLSAFIGVSAAYSQTYEPDPSLPEAVQMHGRCAAKAGQEACWGFAVRPEIPAYSQPDASSRIISQYPLGSYISLIEPSESGDHPGWLSVVAVINNNKYVSAWVRSADIVLASDLRRVVECWPVQALNWNEEGAGDYEGGQFRLRFAMNGAIQPGKRGKGRGDDNDYFAKHLAVYYARGVFLIRHRTDPNAGKGGFWPIFMLDYPNRHVTISAPARRPFWQLFSDEKLKGCTDIPRVDPKSGVKFK